MAAADRYFRIGRVEGTHGVPSSRRTGTAPSAVSRRTCADAAPRSRLTQRRGVRRIDSATPGAETRGESLVVTQLSFVSYFCTRYSGTQLAERRVNAIRRPVAGHHDRIDGSSQIVAQSRVHRSVHQAAVDAVEQRVGVAGERDFR